MNKINWGIIGCGDVTEIKSGPAFNKVPNSELVGVMRRNADKAADYARRHAVPYWCSDAKDMINDPKINALYIATPPAFHEAYTLAAIKAGKPVYVEKPMSLNYKQAQRMHQAALEQDVKLVVAHYRREWPLFKKVKALVDTKAIGEMQLVNLVYNRPALTMAQLADEKMAWRVNPALSGGGFFHDLAPHQLDILYHLFGDARRVHGIACNQGGLYQPPDLVSGHILFSNQIVFTGTWCFNAAQPDDFCQLTGSRGTIRFSFFSSNDIALTVDGHTTIHTFDALEHVQQPMIEKTTQYFLGRAGNPCSGYDGTVIMRWMDIIVSGR